MVAPELFYFGMRNPEAMYMTADAVNDIFNPSMPPSNPYIQLYEGLDSLWNIVNE
jgi:hypothetical protein